MYKRQLFKTRIRTRQSIKNKKEDECLSARELNWKKKKQVLDSIENAGGREDVGGHFLTDNYAFHMVGYCGEVSTVLQYCGFFKSRQTVDMLKLSKYAHQYDIITRLQSVRDCNKICNMYTIYMLGRKRSEDHVDYWNPALVLIRITVDMVFTFSLN